MNLHNPEIRRFVLPLAAIFTIGTGAEVALNRGAGVDNPAVSSSQVDPEALSTRLIPTATPTVIPSVIPLITARKNSSPTVESGAVRFEGVKVYDNNRFQQENINPHDPAAFMNFQTSCKESPTRVARRAQTVGGLASLALSKVRDLFVSTAEAETLETPEEFIKCIQDIEAQRPFLTSEAFAKQLGFKTIEVKNLRPEDVIGIDTVENWQKNLAPQLQKKGYDISDEEIKAFFDSLQLTFRDPKTGEVGVFQPKFLSEPISSDITTRSIKEKVAPVVDPATGQLFIVEKRTGKVCDNISTLLALIKKLLPTPPASQVPQAPPSGESPSSTPTAVRPGPSETPTEVPVPPTQPATPTAAPTNIAPVPTETAGPTATLVPTRTPGAATPTAIAAATPTAISAATPTAIGGAPSAPTAVKPGG